jgi:hypothetical protein
MWGRLERLFAEFRFTSIAEGQRVGKAVAA